MLHSHSNEMIAMSSMQEEPSTTAEADPIRDLTSQTVPHGLQQFSQ